MNRRHVAAILWLRWRLARRQWKRGGAIGAVLGIVIAVSAVLTAMLGFTVAVVVGIRMFPRAEPDHLLLVWDLAVVGFLFFWIIGVVSELQRTEVLSLDKLLHLPISLRGAFLLNYMSSYLSLSLIVFGSVMLGMSVALIVVAGPAMIMTVPLIASMVLLVTAVTYQFRGWLAALMVNKRRRGTIIAVMTVTFIGLAQLPNFFLLRGAGTSELHLQQRLELETIREQRASGALTPEKANEETLAVSNRYNQKRAEVRRARRERIQEIALTANAVVPVGWLPYGTRALAQGRIWPAVFGCLGAILLAGLSLARSYSTTLKLYTGGFQPGARARRAPAPRAAKEDAATGTNLMERALPGCSEQTAAVAVAGFRSLIRSPQAKLLLMTPIILLLVFGVLLFGRRSEALPEIAAPLIALGAVVLSMLCLVQLIQNLFGFDRDGFRVLVLTAAPRREILIGKNIAVAPLAFGIGGAGLLLTAWCTPLSLLHLVASGVQLVCVYLICCMVGNTVSILAPIAMATGTLKPAHPKWLTFLKQAVFMFLFPIALAPTLIPLGLELLIPAMDWGPPLPLYLIGSLLELPIVLWIYRRVVSAQGRMLQRREQRVLDEVTVAE